MNKKLSLISVIFTAFLLAAGVASAAGTLQLGAPDPSSGSVSNGTRVTFNVTITTDDPAGPDDIERIGFAVTDSSLTSFTGSNDDNCFYALCTNYSANLYDYGIRNDAGSSFDYPVSPATTVENSQAILYIGSSYTHASAGANSITLTVSVEFKRGFEGSKKLWVAARNAAGTWFGFNNLGTFTVTNSLSLALDPLALTTYVGDTDTFTTDYTDTHGEGAAHLTYTGLAISAGHPGTDPEGDNAFSKCAGIIYERATNKVYLVVDNGVPSSVTDFADILANHTTSTDLDTGTVDLENSYVKVLCTQMQAPSTSTDGKTLTIAWKVVFKDRFTGQKGTYLYAQDIAGNKTGWEDKGNCQIDSTKVISSPGTCTVGTTYDFSLEYYDDIVSADTIDIRYLYFTVSSTDPSINNLYQDTVIYDTVNNLLYLVNDSGLGTTGSWRDYCVNPSGTAPGGADAANSHINLMCSLMSAPTLSANGTTGKKYPIIFKVQFKSGFTGTKNVYALIQDISAAKVLVRPAENKGSITINTGTAPTPGTVTYVPPAPLVNQVVTFSVPINDGSGGHATKAYFVVADTKPTYDLNDPSSFKNTLAVYYDNSSGNNTFYLVNDDPAAAPNTGWDIGDFTKLETTDISNIQGTLILSGTAPSTSASALTLTVSAKFTSAFTGQKTLYVWAKDGDNNIADFTTNGNGSIAIVVAIEPEQANLILTPGTDSMALSWTDAWSGETGLEVWRKDEVNTAYAKIGSTLAPGSTTYQDASLSEGIKYTYKIRAIYSTNPDVYSDSIEASAYTKLEAPTDLTYTFTQVSGTSYKVALTWTDNSAADTHYEIYRIMSSDGGTTWPAWPATATASVSDDADSSSDTDTYEDATVSNANAYRYKVRAVKKDAQNSQALTDSSYSNTVTENSEGAPFTVRLIADDTTPAQGGSVSFTVSVEGNANPIAKYEFDLDGNGTHDQWYYGTEFKPASNAAPSSLSFKYTAGGGFNPGVRVTDSTGATVEDSETITVSTDTANSPEADIQNTATTVAIASPIGIEADAAPAEKILRYEWDINGDGEYDTSSTESGAIAFTIDKLPSADTNGDGKIDDDDDNSFWAKVKVTSSNGLSAIDDMAIIRDASSYATINVPNISIVCTNATQIYADTQVNFSVTSSANNGVKKIAVDFESDGRDDYVETGTDLSSPGKTVSHAYGVPGKYTARVKAYNTDHVFKEATKEITVLPKAGATVPTAMIEQAIGGSGSANAPFRASFDPSGSTAATGVTISKYEWDFDGDKVIDLVAATDDPVSYTYEFPGYYVAMLRITDSTGLVDCAYFAVSVAAPAAGCTAFIRTPADSEAAGGDILTLLCSTVYDTIPDTAATINIAYMQASDAVQVWQPIEGAVNKGRSYAVMLDTTQLTDSGSYEIAAYPGDQAGTSMLVNGITISNANSANADIYERKETSNNRIKTIALKPERSNMIFFPGGNASAVSFTDSANINIPTGLVAADNNVSITGEGEGIGRRIKTELATQVSGFNKDLVVMLSYPDADNDGIVDGTDISETTLVLQSRADQNSEWEKTFDPVVYTYENVAVAKVNHFSEFGFGVASTPLTEPVTGGRKISVGGGGGGGCFIATAAYGTPMAVDVIALRQFRDTCLLKNELGRRFVDAYYRTSPPVADYIRNKPALRAIVRMLLRPLVKMAGMLS